MKITVIDKPHYVTFMGRKAQVISKYPGYSRHGVHIIPTPTFYDLKMLDSGSVFHRVKTTRCEAYEEESQPLRLVKA